MLKHTCCVFHILWLGLLSLKIYPNVYKLQLWKKIVQKGVIFDVSRYKSKRQCLIKRAVMWSQPAQKQGKVGGLDKGK